MKRKNDDVIEYCYYCGINVNIPFEDVFYDENGDKHFDCILCGHEIVKINED